MKIQATHGKTNRTPSIIMLRPMRRVRSLKLDGNGLHGSILRYRHRSPATTSSFMHGTILIIAEQSMSTSTPLVHGNMYTRGVLLTANGLWNPSIETM
ncbi:MAG: hypothetical protein NT038_10210 [Euryarchaeota archaeon]|nr:hypothetical protein [Euryarchaeota archaeon]